jgi:hypothetical protein
MGFMSWLFGNTDALPGWTPQRAAQAERDTLLAQGIVVEPVFSWSKPAQERERVARLRREQSWRKRTQATQVRRA